MISDPNPNIASDAENQVLLHALFEAMEPFGGEFLISNPQWQARITHWPGDKRTRLLEFLGNIAWEIFSQNNEVVSLEGLVYDLGSWRGTGGTIADFLNIRLGEPRFEYIDFYMGLMSRADVELRPLYARFFEVLKQRGCDWRYAPPAIYLHSFEKEREDPADYDPEKAVRDELEGKKNVDEKRSELAQMNREAFQEAEENPPAIVRAYEDVYGRRPAYVKLDRG